MPSAIDPTQIPGKDIDPDTIEAEAGTVAGVATSVRDNGSDVHRTWQGMAAVYSAPESGTLLGLMQPVSTQATAVGDNLDVVSAALTQFAADVRPIKAELDSLRLQAEAFRAEIAGGVRVRELNPAWVSTQGYQGSWSAYGAYSSPSTGGTTATADIPQYQTVTKEWHEDQASVDRNNDLIAAVNAQQVALWEAERACANKIRALYGAAALHAAQSEDDSLAYGLSEIPEGTEMPRGAPVERTEGCGEATATFIFKDFLWEGIAVGGVWGTIQGLGTLVLGYNPATGDWFSGDAYGAAWGNLGMLAAGLALNSGPMGVLFAADDAMQQFGGGGFLPDEVSDFKDSADEALLNTGKALIAWDKWQDDPGTALGESVFNVGTALIPVGGAAVAGVKTASTAASVLTKMTRVVEFVDPAAWAMNGTMKLGSAGLGSLDNLIGKMDFAATNFDAPHIEVYTAMDSPSALGALDDWGVDLNTVTARVDDGIPVLEFPGGRVELPAGAFDNAGGGVRIGDEAASVTVPVRESELVSAGGVRGETGPGAVNSIVDEAPVRTENGGSGESTVIRDPETDLGGDRGGADATPGGGDHPGAADGGADAQGGDAGGGSGGEGTPGSGDMAPGDPSDPVVWRSTEDPSLTLTESQKAAVDDFLDGSRAAEPTLTDSMQRIESQHPDARLEGLEYRLKGEDSLYRKVSDDLRDYAPGAGADDAIAGVKDSIRYTYVVPEGSYSPTVSGILDDLQREGLVPYGPLKNSWGADGYVGINSTWFDPSSGRLVEVQFHTDASFDAKMTTHEPYETVRLPGVDPELKLRLETEMNEVFAGVRTPDGATGIDWPTPMPGSGYADATWTVAPEPFPSPDSPAPVDFALADRAIVSRFDPTTPPGSAVFWSGRVDLGGDFGSAMDGAGVYAASHRASTLEQLLESQGLLDDMPGDWSRPETGETWRAVSSSLAENARGDVVAYVGDVRAGSVWNLYELPRLLANDQVTRITLIDAHTGKALHVYER